MAWRRLATAIIGVWLAQACTASPPVPCADPPKRVASAHVTQQPIPVRVTAHDVQACVIAAPAAVQTNPADRLLVDVRATAAINRAWIPGAITLSLDGLATSAAVRSARQVLITGTGQDDAQLVHECAELQRIGLDRVRVIRGGVPAWSRAGGTVDGDGAGLRVAQVLDPAEMYRITRWQKAALVGVGLPARVLARYGAAENLELAEGVEPREAITAITKWRRQVRGVAVIAPVVLVLPADAHLPDWQRAVDHGAEDAVGTFLLYAAGHAAFDAHTRLQPEVIANANKPLSHSCDRS